MSVTSENRTMSFISIYIVSQFISNLSHGVFNNNRISIVNDTLSYDKCNFLEDYNIIISRATYFYHEVNYTLYVINPR